jgi:hypothetical protein
VKNTPFLLWIVIFVAALSHPASLPHACAEEQSADDAAYLLTSGPWKITFQKGVVLIRVFKRDGTFFTPDRPDQTGRWEVVRKTVVQTHPDGHQDLFALPLRAEGTVGSSWEGEALRAVLDKSAPVVASTAPLVSQPAATPQVAASTPPAASAPPDEAAPSPTAVSAQAKTPAGILLISAPWKFLASSWFSVRIFAQDGTFTTIGNKEQHGTWDISSTAITLTFADTHKETVSLPLDPKGTGGLDKQGRPITASIQTPPRTPTVMDDRTKAATTALLISAPWKIKGSWWSTIRTFASDGTFATPGNGGESGPWVIADNKIFLTVPDGHKDTLSLPLDAKGTDGADRDGAPTYAVLQDAATVASQRVPAPRNKPKGAGTPFGSTEESTVAVQVVSPEVQDKASDLVKAYRNSLVFVTGKDAAGSGFIATLSGSNYLITNAHVAAGVNGASFKTLEGTSVQAGAASVAVGHDIFCMAMPAGGKPLEIMQDVDTNAAIGDDVVVLGNAEGQGVINTITGKIVGFGPNLVEVDAPFVPGNSGSPIIHLKTGKVIGVATYAVIKTYDAMTNEKIAKPVIRRFGYRLDSVKQWQTVNWRYFYAQAAEMEKVETLTADLDDFFNDLQENKGSVTLGRHTDPAIKYRIDQWIEDRSGRRSAADVNTADVNFLSFLKIACQSDVAAAKPRMTYDYFQRKLADEQQTRDEMSKAFEKIIKNIRD